MARRSVNRVTDSSVTHPLSAGTSTSSLSCDVSGVTDVTDDFCRSWGLPRRPARRRVRDALRAAGVRYGNGVIAAAVRVRKARAAPPPRTVDSRTPGAPVLARFRAVHPSSHTV